MVTAAFKAVFSCAACKIGAKADLSVGVSRTRQGEPGTHGERSMSDESNDAALDQTRKRRTAMATSVTVGAAIGAVLGVAMDSMGFGIAIGVAVGVAIGVAREIRLR
jgi:hypothetical protein